MKKLLFFTILTVFCLLSLIGCTIFGSNEDGNNDITDPGNDSTDTTPPENGDTPSEGDGVKKEIHLFVSSQNIYINEGNLYNEILKATGIMPKLITDEDAPVDGVELVFGDTDREISRLAYDYFEELPITSDDATVLIYRKNLCRSCIF